MSDRPAKLRRLDGLRRKLPHATASAFSEILAAVRDEGVPDVFSRKALREARNAEASLHTPIGPIYQTRKLISHSGATRDVYFAHPLALIWASVHECEPFALFLRKRLVECPATPENPWKLILYSDEVTPGNALKHENHRRFHATYFSFAEFGHNALSREDAWFCCSSMSSIAVKELSAGLSQLIGAVLKLCFDGGCFDLKDSGIYLPFVGGGVRLFAKLGIVIQDGGAHKSTWHGRGDAASKFCLLCRNLFTARSRFVGSDGSGLLRCNVIHESDLVPASSADLRNTARRLEAAAGTIPKQDFDDLQQAVGMTHHEHSMLLDRSLGRVLHVAEVYQHDWMHGLFIDGVFSIQLHLLLETFLKNGRKTI